MHTCLKFTSFSLLQISGSGPVQYVSLVQQIKEEKKKSKQSQKQPQEVPPQEPLLSPHQPPQQPVISTPDPAKRADSSPLKLQEQPHSVVQPAAESLSSSSSGGAVEGNLDVPDSAKGGGGGGGGEGFVLRLEDKDSQRLASETHRLLQCHHEHAMTVSELVQSFKEAEDPLSPEPEVLHLCLHKHNVKKGGSKSPSIFQVVFYASCLHDIHVYWHMDISGAQSSSECAVYTVYIVQCIHHEYTVYIALGLRLFTARDYIGNFGSGTLLCVRLLINA